MAHDRVRTRLIQQEWQLLEPWMFKLKPESFNLLSSTQKVEAAREGPRSQILPQTGDSKLRLLVLWEKMKFKNK